MLRKFSATFELDGASVRFKTHKRVFYAKGVGESCSNNPSSAINIARDCGGASVGKALKCARGHANEAAGTRFVYERRGRRMRAEVCCGVAGSVSFNAT